MARRTSRPIITLTTDFGLADHYVGTMKGVILSRCPAAIIDISHEIPAFSRVAGAYTVDQAARFFPPGTIHVVVVDPGVGTSRKAIFVEASGQRFIAPDNGVLTLIQARDPQTRTFEIANSQFFLHPVSDTFHGRDIFAPAAAAVANGMANRENIGPPLAAMELLGGLRPDRISENTWTGIVLSVDHFGNIITNFEAAKFTEVTSSRFELLIDNRPVTAFHRTFGGAAPGACFVYFGSSGFLEVAINQASAAQILAATPGAPVVLTRMEMLPG